MKTNTPNSPEQDSENDNGYEKDWLPFLAIILFIVCAIGAGHDAYNRRWLMPKHNQTQPEAASKEASLTTTTQRESKEKHP